MQPETLKLEPRLDITAAAPLHQALLARMGKELRIDAGEVQRLGGQCLQVLLAAVATWKADGVSIELVQPSPEFADVIRILGIPPENLMMKDAAP